LFLQHKGKYVDRKMTYDLTALAIFPLEGFRWKMRIVSTYGESADPLLCHDYESSIRLISSKKKKN
jgi:hypothetical protein